MLVCGPAYSAVSSPTCFGTDCTLMLHMNGADGSTTFTDSSFTSTKTVTRQGDAQIDTAQYKFGGASGLFDGTGDYLTTPDNADWSLGSGDFTIDAWVRFNALPLSGEFQAVVGQWNSSNTDDSFIYLLNNTTGTYAYQFFYTTDGATYNNSSFTTTPSTGTWYHVAVIRNGANLKGFVDGSQIGATYNISSSALFASGQALTIGADNNASHFYPFNGWMDELRLVKGTAVWTSSFSVPTAEYSDICTTRKRIRIISGE